MNFSDIIVNRQSCRSYDSEKPVEREKLEAILHAARLSPSACNGQPYFITVCEGELAKKIGKICVDNVAGINKFAPEAPVQLVISEMPYSRSAAIGAKLKKNDYRSIDIGILAAYITAAATEQGLSTCILGWLDDKEIRELCGLEYTVRRVITLGYAKENDPLRPKKRKEMENLVKYVK